MFKRFLLIFRTVRYLKAIQVAYRLKYFALGKIARVIKPCVKGGTLSVSGVKPRTAFPTYYNVWDGGENFTFLNETHPLRTAADWNAKCVKKLWLYNLHYFDCLRDERLRSKVEVEKACGLMDRWIRENPPVKGNGWEPYPISLRVVNWIKWLIRCREEGVGVERIEQRVCPSLVQQMRWLTKRLEYHLLANHLLANAKALVFAGRFFAGREAERWYKTGMDIYRRQLPEQVLDDGVHFELSAMYHAIMLEDVLDCYNLTGDPLFKTYGERMLSGLQFLTGPDGQIAKFNDAAEGIALKPGDLVAYAWALGIEVERVGGGGDEVEKRGGGGQRSDFSFSGFERQEVGKYVMIAKCGAIGPRYQPGHAHADTFSFEMWRDGVKIVADTGTDRYVVDDERKRQRGTAAHNTVVIDGRNSSEVWAGHRVGRRFDARTHQRRFELRADGLVGRDTLSGKGLHTVELRFHAPGEVRFAVDVNAPGVTFERTEEDAMMCEEFGRQTVGRCVCYRAKVALPIEVAWRIW